MDPNEETPLAAPSKGGFGKSLGRGKIAGLLALALGLGVFGALAATDHKTTDIAFGNITPLWACNDAAVTGPCEEKYGRHSIYSSVLYKCFDMCGDYIDKYEGSDFYCGYGDSEAEVARLCCDLWGDAQKEHGFRFNPDDPCNPMDP